jgi:general secretion pathway protein D
VIKIISASADTQRMLAEVIRQLDQRRQQVLIEAIVVELSDNAVRELGVQWLLAGEDGNPVGLTNYSDRAAPLVPLAGGAAAGQLDDSDPLREQLQNLALNTLIGANGFVGGGGGSIWPQLAGRYRQQADHGQGCLSFPAPSLSGAGGQPTRLGALSSPPAPAPPCCWERRRRGGDRFPPPAAVPGRRP